jgi:predicted HicB family RNase H-like nuclease
MKYKGYLGSVDYSDEDSVLFGKVEFIRDLISFEGKDVDSLKRAFEEAVDDYLQACQQRGIEPQKPFKGNFNVRTGPDLHRRIATFAAQKKSNLNKVVVDALEGHLSKAGWLSTKAKENISNNQKDSKPRIEH